MLPSSFSLQQKAPSVSDSLTALGRNEFYEKQATIRNPNSPGRRAFSAFGCCSKTRKRLEKCKNIRENKKKHHEKMMMCAGTDEAKKNESKI
jgi:hypothetical protein